MFANAFHPLRLARCHGLWVHLPAHGAAALRAAVEQYGEFTSEVFVPDAERIERVLREQKEKGLLML